MVPDKSTTEVMLVDRRWYKVDRGSVYVDPLGPEVSWRTDGKTISTTSKNILAVRSDEPVQVSHE